MDHGRFEGECPREQCPRGVVITGGGVGVGRATAHAFADRGDRVLVVGRSESTLAETVNDHDTIFALATDITDPAAPAAVVDTALRELGRIDVLVNNASVIGYGAMGRLDRAAVAAEVNTNLLVPIFLTEQALEALEATRGTVVNVSGASSVYMRAVPNNSVFVATKVGINSLTRTWAVELAPRGIRVLAVAPGLIDTGVPVPAGLPREIYEKFVADMLPKLSSGRCASPAEIAWWIVHLTEPNARYANGAVFAIDDALSVI